MRFKFCRDFKDETAIFFRRWTCSRKNFHFQPKFILTFLLLGFFASSNAQSPIPKFFKHLNNYQADSLETLLSEDFLLSRTFANYTNNKSTFLNTYLSHSKNCNATFLLLKIDSSGDKNQYLVKDQSAIFTYLNLPNPVLKLSFTLSNNLIKAVQIDTTAGYAKFQQRQNIEIEHFENWLANKYPSESLQMLYVTEGLLVKRLKEFASRKK
jgi:hypothetical protein